MQAYSKKKYYFNLLISAIIWGGITTPITALLFGESISVSLLYFNVILLVAYTFVSLFIGINALNIEWDTLINALNIEWDTLVPQRGKGYRVFFYPLIISYPLFILGGFAEWLRTGSLPF